MTDDKLNPLHVLCAAFAIASVGGLAALLRSRQIITARAALSATLYSGMTGLVIALFWYNYFHDQGNLYFLLGISGLAGIGGVTIADFVVQVLKNGGISIKITPGEDDTDNNAGPHDNQPIP